MMAARVGRRWVARASTPLRTKGRRIEARTGEPGLGYRAAATTAPCVSGGWGDQGVQRGWRGRRGEWLLAPGPVRRLISSVQEFGQRNEGRSSARGAMAGAELAPGVAGVAGLHSPGDFAPLAAAAVVESDRLRGGISSGEISSPLEILKTVDAISNTVCSVIDAADFLRNAHADQRFRDAADEAFSQLAEYIQDLNTDDALYQALCRVVANKEAMDGFSAEQRRVVNLHMAEFERGGIHLSGDDRAEVVELQNEATKLERLFEYNIIAKRGAFQVDKKDLRGVPEFVLSRIPQPERQPSDRFTLLTDQSVMGDVLKNARSGALRRAMYMAGNSVAVENVQVLERLMAIRHKLAQKVGFESHAHRAISDKMAETPEEVVRFLDALAAGVRDKAKQEADLLRKAKLEVEGSSELFAWDLSYYMGYVKSRECNLDGRSLSEYFTLGGCLEGLRMVCRGLFGISLEQIPLRPGENWANNAEGGGVCGGDGGVRKLVLRHDVEGVLGTIYLDLHRRDGKFGHAAHFTVRCGCVVDPRETADDEGETGVQYQLPIVVLVCNFGLPEPPHHGSGNDQGKGGADKGSYDDDTRLMSHSEVETMFHEFGHALHSLLSRTELQHVSGTRVPVDFCEIPSHLMEHFVWDSSVLTKFARHYRTGESPPPALLDRLHKSKTLFAGMGIQTQLLYATLDQRLFGPQPDGGVWSSTSLADGLQEQLTSIPRCDGAFWHSRFGHFTGYGASYYAYLYAKMFTSGIWERHFAADPFNRNAGELLWKHMLIHGGAKDPHEMLETLLGDGLRGEEGIRAGVTSLLKDIGVS